MRRSILESISDPAKTAILAGGERHLHRMEGALSIRILSRDSGFVLEGSDASDLIRAEKVLVELEKLATNVGVVEDFALDRLLSESVPSRLQDDLSRPILYDARGQAVRARTEGQHRLVKAATRCDLTFAIGPAGTGKTYLAIAMAVAALQRREVDRIVLVRPAVEAGEELGFLPGDLKEKIAPYLQPMTDALQELLPRARYRECLEAGMIEMAPLAYMRGRTLKRVFAILDEAQNATIAQMKMFLTRLGAGSRSIVTGDPTQVDLPSKVRSGLEHAVEILRDVPGIEQIHLQSRDQMRHPLVQAIIDAYDCASSESNA